MNTCAHSTPCGMGGELYYNGVMLKLGKLYSIRKDHLILGFIILLAILLRFTRYSERWGLASDQARDALVAREVLAGKPLPMIGPFSSAGNFTTGPVWYWFVTGATTFNPTSVTTPWVVLTATYVGMVILLYITGRIIAGPALGVILGLFAAVSPAQISQGFNLTNPSLVAVFATIALWAGVQYLKTGKTIPLVVLGLATGCAVSTHYQAALLSLYVFLVFAFRRPTLKQFLLFLLFGVVSFIPLIIFDLAHKFYNARGMRDYFLYEQFKIYVPNRWLTYAGEFIPRLWGGVIGGQNVFGYGLIVLAAVASIIAYLVRLYAPSSVSILVSLAAMIVFLRYYRGERFESYFVFLHPFILAVSAWTCWIVYKKQKIVAVALIAAVVLGSLWATVPNIPRAYNHTAWQASNWSQLLIATYPSEKFDLYDYLYRASNQSYALALYLDVAGKISPDGRKIGFGLPPKLERPFHHEIPGNTFGFDLWDLNASSSAMLQANDWARVNPEDIYLRVAQWGATNTQ